VVSIWAVYMIIPFSINDLVAGGFSQWEGCRSRTKMTTGSDRVALGGDARLFADANFGGAPCADGSVRL
jgi:hypothetical protein